MPKSLLLNSSSPTAPCSGSSLSISFMRVAWTFARSTSKVAPLSATVYASFSLSSSAAIKAASCGRRSAKSTARSGRSNHHADNATSSTIPASPAPRPILARRSNASHQVFIVRSSDLHPHDILVGFQDPVADLQHQLEGDAALLEPDHH